MPGSAEGRGEVVGAGLGVFGVVRVFWVLLEMSNEGGEEEEIGGCGGVGDDGVIGAKGTGNCSIALVEKAGGGGVDVLLGRPWIGGEEVVSLGIDLDAG